MPSSSLFSLRDVYVAFPSVKALDGVSLDIGKGEQVAFVGPSGSGKTTLLRLLNGTLRPTSGEVRVIDQQTGVLAPQALRAIRSRIGFIHQDLSLVPNLRVLQNVLSGRMGRISLLGCLRMLTFPGSAETAEVYELLKRVGIEEKLYERADRLSGGQQQRVAIARTLYQQPDSLLADEPVSSVDPARARETIRLLQSISQEEGLTLCVSLHNLTLAREFFPRIVGLREGKIVIDQASSELTDSQFEELYQLTKAQVLV